jgi:hypothetical protein
MAEEQQDIQRLIQMAREEDNFAFVLILLQIQY